MKDTDILAMGIAVLFGLLLFAFIGAMTFQENKRYELERLRILHSQTNTPIQLQR